ncbi:MAG: BamA/TamA family outer membrane protein [Bacteroidia bacterium]
MRKFFVIACTCFVFAANAQFLKQDTSKNYNILPLPLVFKSPETGWAGGLSGSLSFKSTHKHDSLTRTSTVQLLTLFTERGQNIQALDATIYMPKEKYILYVQASHSYFPDKFWGLGPLTTNDYEKYSFQQFFTNIHLKKKIYKKLFGGLIYEFQNVFDIHYIPGGKFDTSIVYGHGDYHNSGFGGSLGIDTRNSSFFPTKGIFCQSLMTYFNTFYGAQFNNLRTVIDFRMFKKVFKKHVIAAQVYSYSNSGQTPLRDLAALGGSGNLRGFYQGRFRDNSLLTFIAEYRAPIYGRLGITVFGGAGNVYNKLDEIDRINQNIKYSFGGGLRFAVLQKERLNLRLDYGYYDNFNKGFYFTIGECF